MNQVLPIHMTVDQFLRWSARREGGRYELEGGRILEMPAETARHVRVKHLVHHALTAAIARTDMPFYAWQEGMSVQIEDGKCYEPDVYVAALPLPPEDSLLVDNPAIVVEVLSEHSARRDLTTKVAGYARVPSIEHYVVVDPADRVVLHYRRQGGIFAAPIELTEGTLRLDPPGLDLPLTDMLGPPPAEASEASPQMA